jgi:hypothetical protein
MPAGNLVSTEIHGLNLPVLTDRKTGPLSDA